MPSAKQSKKGVVATKAKKTTLKTEKPDGSLKAIKANSKRQDVPATSNTAPATTTDAPATPSSCREAASPFLSSPLRSSPLPQDIEEQLDELSPEIAEIVRNPAPLIELPKLWEPVFPKADQLLELNPHAEPVAMMDMPAVKGKIHLTPQVRRANGWTDHEERKELHSRETLISDILVRWWYVFPQWPPLNYDWDAALASKGYRKVALEDWLVAADVDENGLSKVYELSKFPGVFRNRNQDRIDLRPAHNCPNFINLQQQTTKDLLRFLERALDNQLQIIRQTKVGNEKQVRELIAKYQKDGGKLIKTYDDPNNDYMRKLKGYLSQTRRQMESNGEEKAEWERKQAEIKKAKKAEKERKLLRKSGILNTDDDHMDDAMSNRDDDDAMSNESGDEESGDENSGDEDSEDGSDDEEDSESG